MSTCENNIKCPEKQCCNSNNLCGTGFDYCDKTKIKCKIVSDIDNSDPKTMEEYYKNTVTVNNASFESCGPKKNEKGEILYTRCRPGEYCNNNYKCKITDNIENVKDLNKDSYYDCYNNNNKYTYNGDKPTNTNNYFQENLGGFIILFIILFVVFLIIMFFVTMRFLVYIKDRKTKKN